VFQCFDGSLNTYLDKCIEIIALFDNFTVQHVFRHENTMTKYLAQQASGFDQIEEKLVFWRNRDVPVYQTRHSILWLMHSVTVCSAERSSTKLDVLISETGGSEISRILDEASKITTADPDY
jgi:hypothetical protein